MNREKLMKIFQKLLIYFLIACSINQIKKNIFTILSIQKSYLCINHLNFLRVLPNIKFYNEQRKKKDIFIQHILRIRFPKTTNTIQLYTVILEKLSHVRNEKKKKTKIRRP